MQTATKSELHVVTRGELGAFLKLCEPLIDRRAKVFLPSLLFGVRNGRLRVAFRGRTFSGFQKIGPFGYTDTFDISVDYRELEDGLKTMGDTVALSWDRERLYLRDGSSERQIAHNMDCTLPDTSAGPVPSVKVPSLWLLDLAAMLRVAQEDSPRSYGTVVRMESKNGTGRLVATDGFRLARSEYLGLSQAAEVFHELLLPYAASEQLLVAAESGKELTLAVSECRTTLAVQIGDDATAYFRTSGVKYPNYAAILPKTTRGQTIVVKELLATVKRALKGADKSHALSIIAKSGKMIVRAKHYDDAEFRVCAALDLPGHFDLGGKEFCLNGRFLVAALSGAKRGTVGSIAFPDDVDHPVTLTVGSVMTLVVPIRMNK